MECQTECDLCKSRCTTRSRNSVGQLELNVMYTMFRTQTERDLSKTHCITECRNRAGMWRMEGCLCRLRRNVTYASPIAQQNSLGTWLECDGWNVRHNVSYAVIKTSQCCQTNLIPIWLHNRCFIDGMIIPNRIPGIWMKWKSLPRFCSFQFLKAKLGHILYIVIEGYLKILHHCLLPARHYSHGYLFLLTFQHFLLILHQNLLIFATIWEFKTGSHSNAHLISILFHNIDGMDQIKGTTSAKANVVISLFSISTYIFSLPTILYLFLVWQSNIFYFSTILNISHIISICF